MLKRKEFKKNINVFESESKDVIDKLYGISQSWDNVKRACHDENVIANSLSERLKFQVSFENILILSMFLMFCMVWQFKLGADFLQTINKEKEFASLYEKGFKNYIESKNIEIGKSMEEKEKQEYLEYLRNYKVEKNEQDSVTKLSKDEIYELNKYNSYKSNSGLLWFGLLLNLTLNLCIFGFIVSDAKIIERFRYKKRWLKELEEKKEKVNILELELKKIEKEYGDMFESCFKEYKKIDISNIYYEHFKGNCNIKNFVIKKVIESSLEKNVDLKLNKDISLNKFKDFNPIVFYKEVKYNINEQLDELKLNMR